jgi:hypothetical protein
VRTTTQQQTSTPRALLAAALQLALVAGMAGAAWGVYRRLPGEGAGTVASGAATLRIVLRREGAAAVAGAAEVPVQLYSIDVAAARREFEDERRYGQRFEDFVARRMGARKPLSARLDADGQAFLTVPHGRWWVHATLPGESELTWRLPVNVSGREQTVELNGANAFTRTKTF